MFTKVLIANRGEIALRVIRTCRELGLQTVAVFSEADRQALHVRYADEAYLLGAPAARASYLLGDKIVEIALKSGAGAIHPGYGFLAERADFAQACLDAGLAFIGPRPSAIMSMGDKAKARSIVAEAGVPVIPGTQGEGALSDDDLLAIAPTIGFPLLVKASAGGGGKGIREAHSLEELPALIHAARREAEASFGDDHVYLEKLVKGARQIEFQILADQHGNAIHLGERECSIQRHHQKLLEEAPSPFINGDADLRQRMGAVAVRVAQAVGYVNAGTIEFLVDKDKNFYFLEMNPRLQVEHPVTEMVSGVDIVKEQIRIARGRQLHYVQTDVRQHGWAIECHINAEDPYNNYLPSTGKISSSILPTGHGVRIDSGVYLGFEISPYYDSLISKLIVWGETRAEAILRMRRALEEYRIVGVRTNIPFHQKLMDSHRFMSGKYDTRFIDEHFSMEERVEDQQAFAEIAAIFATLVTHQQSERSTLIVRRDHRESGNWKLASRIDGMQR